jgi:hypothetical protein
MYGTFTETRIISWNAGKNSEFIKYLSATNVVDS